MLFQQPCHAGKNEKNLRPSFLLRMLSFEINKFRNQSALLHYMSEDVLDVALIFIIIHWMFSINVKNLCFQVDLLMSLCRR